MRATKKASKKKRSWEKYIWSYEKNLFFLRMFFYLPKLTVFFRKSAAIQYAHMFFFGNALPKSNARAHLKQRKNTVA